MGKMTINSEQKENEDNGEKRGGSDPTNLELGLDSSSWGGSSRTIDGGRLADSGKREQNLPLLTMSECSTFTKHGLPIICPEVEGASSSEFSGTSLESNDLLKHLYRDFQHKRPKVLRNYESNIPECPAVATDDMMDDYYINDYENRGNSMDSEVFRNIVIGDDTNAKDDKLLAGNSEVKMDLAEDLLHLVFSFLSHRDLCKAGATCKQWHATSSHEEFWRSLNFKDMNITPENCSHALPLKRRTSLAKIRFENTFVPWTV